jgi:hypothetical protein
LDDVADDVHQTSAVTYQRTDSQQSPAHAVKKDDVVVLRGSQAVAGRGNQCSSLLARAAEAFHRRHVSERLHHQQVAELRAFSDLLLAQMQYQYQNHYHHHHQYHHHQQQQQWKMRGGQRHHPSSQQYSQRNHHQHTQPTMQCSGHFRSDAQNGRFPFPDPSDMICANDCRRLSTDCQRSVPDMTSSEIGCAGGRRMHHNDQVDVCSSDSLKPSIATPVDVSAQYDTDMRSTSPQHQNRTVQQPTSTTVTINGCGTFREDSIDDDLASCSRLDDHGEISVDEDDDALYYTQDDNNGGDADQEQANCENNDLGKLSLLIHLLKFTS